MEGLVNVLQRARTMGIRVMCGTDTGNYSWMPYGKMHAKEAEIFVRYGGYTPLEENMACTRDNAFAVGLENEMGVLETRRVGEVIHFKEKTGGGVKGLEAPSQPEG